MKKYLAVITVLLFLTTITGFGAIWYIQILKWLVCIGAAMLAYRYLKVNKVIFYIFLATAIIFNPIVPIYFQEIGRIVCFLAGVIFLPFAFEKYLPFVMKFCKETVSEIKTENTEAESVENKAEEVEKQEQPEQKTNDEAPKEENQQ